MEMNMFLIPNRPVIISAVTCCLLLLSNGSFANNQKNLEDAIAQNSFEDAEKALLASDIDVKKINNFYPLPSAKMSELLLDGGLDLRRFFGLVMRSYVYNGEGLTKQQELVKITLARGLNPNILLQVAVSQTLSVGGSNHHLQLFNQESYLKMALDAGASFAKVKLPDYWSTSKLVSPEVLTLMVDNGLDPNQALIPLAREWGCEKDDVKYEQRKKLLETVLERGGSANKLLELAITRRVELDANRSTLVNICAKDDELIRLALQHGAKFSEIKLPEHWTMNGFISPVVIQLMLDNSMDPNRIIVAIVDQWGCEKDDVKDEQRKKLLEMVLERGGSANKLLELAITRRVELGENRYTLINICAKDDELIRLALQHGAKFSEIKLPEHWRMNGFISPEVIQLMLDNSMDPNRIIVAIVDQWGCENDDVKYEQRKKILEMVLEKGGSANKLLELAIARRVELGENSYYSINICAKDDELIKLALQHGAKFSEIKLPEHWTMNGFISPEVIQLMLDNSMDPNRIIVAIVGQWDCENDEVKYEQRKKILEMVLERGGSANKLLELAIARRVELGENSYYSINICAKDDEFIKLALQHGAKLAKVKMIINKINSFPTIEGVKLMLENPFDPKDSLDKSLLITMIVNGKVEIYDHIARKVIINNESVAKQQALIAFLVEQGVDLNKIKYFIELPSLELSKLLLEKGLARDTFLALIANIMLPKQDSEEGSMEIDDGLVRQRDDLVKALFGEGIKIAETNMSIWSEIMQLGSQVFGGSEKMKDPGAKINLKNVNGKTLLMLVAECGYIIGVESLINKDGADPSIKDSNGKTALDLAREKGVATEYLEELLKPKQVENSGSKATPEDNVKEESKKSDHTHEEL